MNFGGVNFTSHNGLYHIKGVPDSTSRLQKAGDAVIKAKQLQVVAGAYLAGMGYYVEISPEIPNTDLKPDVVGIKPKLEQIKLRLENKGGAPTGFLYLLSEDEWTPTESIVEKTGFDEDFVKAVLRDSEEDGWIKSKNEPGDKVFWKIDRYRLPAEECVMMCCGAEDALGALDILEGLKGCFNRGYVLFPYQVDEEFLDRCFQSEIGVLFFDERIVSFREMVPAKHLEIKNFKAYSTICEKIVVDNYVMRTGEYF